MSLVIYASARRFSLLRWVATLKQEENNKSKSIMSSLNGFCCFFFLQKNEIGQNSMHIVSKKANNHEILLQSANMGRQHIQNLIKLHVNSLGWFM